MNRNESESLPVEESPQEIERKFLLKYTPEDYELHPNEDVLQGYFAISEDGTEVRLRKKGDKYYETIKNGTGRVRKEAEIEISEGQFNLLWHTTEGKRLEKTRYYISQGENVTIELDVYKGDLEGLVVAEVEFKTLESSNLFQIPEWFGEEVTGNDKYSNSGLASNGLPFVKESKEKEIDEDLNIPIYEKEEGLKTLNLRIEELLKATDQPIIVEIAGGSASGKTSAVAAKVKEQFGIDALIISMDDYYRGIRFMKEQASLGNDLNWDQPEALNIPLLKKQIHDLKEGKSIEKPIYDFPTATADKTQTIDPKRIIIIEGLFAITDEIKEEADVRAFVDIGMHGRLIRRLLRDIERTGQKPSDILSYFSEVVEPMHDKYIESTKKNADLIIKNEYSPKVEAARSGFHEVQLKFKDDYSENKLIKAGAERLGSFKQIDNYYNPADRNLVETGEILRIRDEGDYSILTYKGPKTRSPYSKRPKFEFEIDDFTKQKFFSLYGDSIKTIKKERTLYQLEGVVLSVDKVEKIEKGLSTPLGTFIELRSSNKDVRKFKNALLKLGIDPAVGIKQSYFEM